MLEFRRYFIQYGNRLTNSGSVVGLIPNLITVSLLYKCLKQFINFVDIFLLNSLKIIGLKINEWISD